MAHDHKDDLIGKIQEKTGWLTADREAEAEGKMRRLKARQGGEDASDDEAEAVAEEAEQDLRESYGEYDPDVDGKPTAPDVRPVEE